MAYVILHCKPSLKDTLITKNIPFVLSHLKGDTELDAIVLDGSYSDLDSGQINSVESSDCTETQYNAAIADRDISQLVGYPPHPST